MPLRVERIRDRRRIEEILRRNATAHVYAIADLDEIFWPETSWYAAFEDDEPAALCLLLSGLRIPIVYAVCPPGHAATRALLRAIGSELPERFFYNLGPGLAEVLLPDWRLAPEGCHWKMALRDRSACRDVPAAGISTLDRGDLDELRHFLEGEAYHAHERGGLFFEARMLDSGCYRAIREDNRLVAVAGVHVHSRRLGVAGLGNVVTRPDARGRGLARRVSAAVIRALCADTAIIGLNVHEQNEPAMRCYRRLGFERVWQYDEGVAERCADA